MYVELYIHNKVLSRKFFQDQDFISMVDQDCLVEIVTGKVIYSVADKVKGW